MVIDLSKEKNMLLIHIFNLRSSWFIKANETLLMSDEKFMMTNKILLYLHIQSVIIRTFRNHIFYQSFVNSLDQ